MLETLKKKWWLIAIVVVVGGVILDNAGIINKSAEKVLKSQDIWAVNMRDSYGEMSEEPVQYLKFKNKDVFASGNLEDIQNMTDSVEDSRTPTTYSDKNTVKLYPDDADGKSISLKFSDLNKDSLKGKFVVEDNGTETSTDMVLKPAK